MRSSSYKILWFDHHAFTPATCICVKICSKTKFKLFERNNFLHYLCFNFLQAKEAKRLKEFLEDYDDDRDDPKYYRYVFVLIPSNKIFILTQLWGVLAKAYGVSV